MAESAYFVTGTTAIGKELGCSSITVLRMIHSKKLNAFRTGDNSSPWKVWWAEIERIRGINSKTNHAPLGAGLHLEPAE